MIRIFLPEQWGKANYGWLNANYLYSFANYYDPDRMGFGPLRVVNHDTIAAGKGFDPHPHNNMEIITIILEGELRHADALGNHGVIRAGDVQRMSAGTGIVHSEINASDMSTRLFQIWIEPSEYHIAPSYEQKSFDRAQKHTALVSRDQQNGSLSINQQVTITRHQLAKDETWERPASDTDACILIGHGSAIIDKQTLPTGTAIEIAGDKFIVTLTAQEPAELYEITWPSSL
jgi:redox-sensitive bicupin YhaK (pirin superfamily)